MRRVERMPDIVAVRKVNARRNRRNNASHVVAVIGIDERLHDRRGLVELRAYGCRSGSGRSQEATEQEAKQ